MNFNISPDKVLDISMEIGLNLLNSGAEISRVENTIIYVSKAYGASKVDVFAIPSLIISTIEFTGGIAVSKMIRNSNVITNLYKLEMFNNLSRNICLNKLSYEEVKNEIRCINENRNMNKYILFSGSLLAASASTIFFGGTYKDALSTLIVAAIMTLYTQWKKPQINKVISVLLTSLIGGFFSSICCFIGLAQNISSVMIGSIMLVIPGLSIATSIKDLMNDDIMSGAFRLFQVIAIVLAIGVGFSIWTKIYGYNVSILIKPQMPLFLSSSIILIFGFAIVYNTRKRNLMFNVILGFFTALVYYELSNKINNSFLIIMIATCFSCGVSEILARIIKAPAIVFMLPTIIFMVPGSSLFYSMYYLLNGNIGMFNDSIKNTVICSLGIAVGIIIISVITQVIMRIVTIKQAN